MKTCFLPQKQLNQHLFDYTLLAHLQSADQWFSGETADPILEPIDPGEDSYVSSESDDGLEEEWHILKKMNIVRSTHYNYINGYAHIESKCFRNLRLATNPALRRTIDGNGKFFAVPWKGTGGRLAIFRLDNPRRIGVKVYI